MDESISFVKKRASGQRPKKRKSAFHGNQYVPPSKKTAPTEFSASARKIGNDSTMHNIDTNFDGYIFVDKELLVQNIVKYLCCANCHGPVDINCTPVYGLSAKFVIICANCENTSTFRNSIMLGDKKSVAEINRRFTYAMRCIGKGDASMRTFCGVMDLHSPVSQKSYDSIVQKINIASSAVAQESMKKGIEDEIGLTESTDIAVSGDGTWKTRGHTSKVGVCTLVGSESGKVVDTLVKSSTCKGCLQWVGERRGKKYEEWLTTHGDQCVKNHSGSSGKMEVDGMIELFQRSEQKRGVRYMKYIGDGDCRTFFGITNAKPYGDGCVQKLECVGHIQKRMGTRLRKLKLGLRGKKCSDNKPLSGKGRLTDAAIDQLTTFYGNAIRQYPDSVRDMQTAIWSIWHHKSSTDKNPIHHFCPKGKDSWCKYQKAVVNGKELLYKHKNSLPAPVMEKVKPIFKELSHPDLLKRCLGGKTQNNNESLNALIWTFCPKVSSAGPNIVQIAVNEAVILFNDGHQGRLKTMQALGLKPGFNAQSAACNADKERLKKSNFQIKLSTLESRKAQRCKSKCNEQAFRLIEGEVYAPGKH